MKGKISTLRRKTTLIPKLGMYIRSATGDQDSLQRQEKSLKAFIKRRPDLRKRDFEIYVDECQSGFKPGLEFLRLQKDIRDGRVNVILVTHMDRLSRSISEILKIFHLLKSKRAELVCTGEEVEIVRWPSFPLAIRGLK